MIFDIFFILLLMGAMFCAWRISVADFRRRIIPDAYLFPLMLIGLLVVNLFSWVCNPIESVFGAVFGYVLASVVGIVFEKLSHNKDMVAPIGMGDIKLLAVGGIWLGTVGLPIALAVSCVLGIIWGCAKKQRYIPFAPFFVMGAILALIVMRFLI